LPLIGFYCPDQQKVAKSICYQKCRLGERCHSLRFLVQAGGNRKWTGKPSTTQLISPTRVEYLKIMNDYYVYPADRAYSVLGVRGHAQLDHVAKSRHEIISEYQLDGDETGILDTLEPDCQQEGYWILIDNKTWGSFSVAKALQYGEIWEATMQLNNYRIKAESDDKLEKIYGSPIKVSKMFVEAIIRDGGTKSAYMNKIDTKTRKIPIERLDDDKVKSFFQQKGNALLSALADKTLPKVCTPNENWNWKRCSKACEVWMFCPEGLKINSRKKY